MSSPEDAVFDRIDEPARSNEVQLSVLRAYVFYITPRETGM